MKSVYLTPEHDEFRRQVRRFMVNEVAPHAEEWEEAGRIPRSIFRRMGELGFLGINFPEAYGGSEGDMFFTMVFLEELPRSRMGGFCAAVSVQQFMATQHIFRHGTEEQKERYLIPSIEGRKVGALAITEPDTGSDVAAIRTSAVKDGESYIINGAKTFITNGADGDFFTLAVKPDPAAGSAGISLIVLDSDLPGVSVAKRLKKLGWYASDTAELAFEDVRVPASQLIGRENMGFYYIMDAFALERLVGAAISVGSSQMCLEEALAYMKQRTAFGRPLTRFQVLTHRLADLAAQIEAARQLTYHAAWLMDQGYPAVTECTMAKLYATELNNRVADACLQCFGGYGFMEEYPMARFYRDARAATIVAGTSEIMREIIARLMTEGGPAPAAEERRAEPAAETEAETPSSGAKGAEPPPAGEAPEVPRTVEGLFASLAERFRPDKVEGWSAVFHYRLADCDHPLWTVEIADGRMNVSEGLKGEPDCLVEMSAQTYLGIETGTINPQVAFMSGQVKVSDLGQMMNYLKAFKPLGK